MPVPALALVGLAGIGVYLFATSAGAAPVTVYEDGSSELPTDTTDPVPQLSDAYPPDLEAEIAATPDADPVLSLLYAIRCAEHNALNVLSGMDYRTFYGGRTFSDLSNHPVLTGELSGVALDPSTCRNAGIASGVCVSTAAGAYQINLPTWREFGLACGETDFSKGAQNRTATRILDSLGAIAAVQRGDVASAITLAARRWASLPGSRSGQGQRSLDFVVSAFNDAQSAQVG